VNGGRFVRAFGVAAALLWTALALAERQKREKKKMKILLLFVVITFQFAYLAKFRNPEYDAPELALNDLLPQNPIQNSKKRSIPFNLPVGLEKFRQMKREEATVNKDVEMAPIKMKQKIVGDIWSNCGNANDELQLKNVTITPDPPKIGQPISVFASGQLTTSIESGTIRVLLYWGKIRLINETLALCDVLVPPLKCPLSAGPTSILVNQQIPSNAPHGNYTGGFIVTDDSNGKEITCISLKFSMN